MSREVKYIVIKDRLDNEIPVMFGATFQHIEIANGICGKTGTKTNVVSAGFVSIQDLDESEEYDSGRIVKHRLNAFGESVSLNKKSRNSTINLHSLRNAP